MANFEGTIIVRSSDGGPLGDYLFYAEIDDVLNVDALGEKISSFSPGSTAYISVNHSSNIIIDSVVPTDGSIQFYETAGREKINDGVLFASRDADDPDTEDLPVIPGSYAVECLGRVGRLTSAANSYGQVTLTGDITKTPFMANITTQYSAKIYKLSIPDVQLDEDETYPIGVVFYISMVR